MDELVVHIETAYIKKLMRLIQDQALSVNDARMVTKHYLALFPFHDVEDIKAKITKFMELHHQFPELAFELKKWDDEAQTRSVINKMREHIKAGEVDKAIAVADSTT